MAGSFIIAVLAAVGYLIKNNLVSNVLIAMAITLILVVTVSLLITFKEYFSLEKLVHDLSEKARKIEQKQKFLKT
jgi:cell division protein FtsL